MIYTRQTPIEMQKTKTKSVVQKMKKKKAISEIYMIEKA